MTIQNSINRALPEEDLKKTVEDFYLPRQLVRAIYDIGHIPAHSQEGIVGVGFIDIADYTYLSKFLSPKENQILLNGLYTAFQMVLERHGGYLNKIEGDSLMFHFDDIIDKRLWKLGREERTTQIAKDLFYTCVEMQRVCVLFNQANDHFLEDSASLEARQALQDAFSIIQTLRNKTDLTSALNAFFQIRIRIGANIGEVTIGNFGPSGSKQWDIIGLPVINAKRMESTAPVGGLRISAEFYDILKQTGTAKDYFDRFKREAALLESIYRDIKEEELFAYREVVVHEKKGASYKTYSVQVYPALPESITRQTEELLNHGKQGAMRIIEFLRYYRGNHYVTNSLESLFKTKGIKLRKQEILGLIHPKRLEAMVQQAREEAIPLDDKLDESCSLYQIMKYMDRYQDMVQLQSEEHRDQPFNGYEAAMAVRRKRIQAVYERRKNIIIQRTYFFEVVVPLVYASIESSILEYQEQAEAGGEADLEELESLEAIT